MKHFNRSIERWLRSKKFLNNQLVEYLLTSTEIHNELQLNDFLVLTSCLRNPYYPLQHPLSFARLHNLVQAVRGFDSVLHTAHWAPVEWLYK